MRDDVVTFGSSRSFTDLLTNILIHTLLALFFFFQHVSINLDDPERIHSATRYLIWDLERYNCFALKNRLIISSRYHMNDSVVK